MTQNIMQQIPNLVITDLHKLDEKVLNGINMNGSANPAQPPSSTSKSSRIDKNKKDLFKKVTSHLVGRNLGQLFKKEVVIKDLPRLGATKIAENNNLLEQTVDNGIQKLFNS